MQNTVTQPPRSFRDLWDLVLLAGLAVLLAGLALLALITPGTLDLDRFWPADPLSPEGQAAFTEVTGLRVLRVSRTAGGGMLELKYQVIDPDKAGIIHDTTNPPVIIDAATGQQLDRPYHDHSSGTEMHTGITYQELLVNVGGVVKAGSRVTVVVGGIPLKNIRVD